MTKNTNDADIAAIVRWSGITHVNSVYLGPDFDGSGTTHYTPFNVRQERDRTVVRHRDTGEELAMPQRQYSTAAERPACGHGKTEFFTDFARAYVQWLNEKAGA